MESADVERGRKLIDCEKCYRLRYCGDNIYYCSFAGQNPCIMGLHTKYISRVSCKEKENVKTKRWEVSLLEVEAMKESKISIEDMAKALNVPNGAVNYALKKLGERKKVRPSRKGYPTETPPFKPSVKKGKDQIKIDWKKHHEETYTAYMNGDRLEDIGARLGCSGMCVLRYLRRYKEE